MAKEQHFAHPPRGHVAILAYDDVNNRWQVVECTADGYLKTRLQEVNGTVAIQQTMPSLLQPGINTYDGSAWHKQPMIWGYTSVWDEDLGGTATGDPYTSTTDAIPAGEVRVLQAVSIRNTARDTTHVFIRINRASGAVMFLGYAVALARYVPLLVTGTFALRQGDVLLVQMGGAVAGDTVQAGIVGYAMQLDM